MSLFSRRSAAAAAAAVGRSLFSGLRSGATSSFQNTLQETARGTLFSQQRTFIQMGTVLNVVDNSGAKKVKCIQALRCRKGARLGDIIVASVKEAHPLKLRKGFKKPFEGAKKGDVVRCVVVRAAMKKGRSDGSEIQFDDNAVVILEKGEPKGTRVTGPVAHELRKNKQNKKILSLAQDIV